MIPVSEPYLCGNALKYVTNCVKTNWISSIGKYVTRFEEEFSKFCNASYGIATANGTVALHLALRVLGIGKGDEVIVPTLTFVATANAVSYLGARPVFVDSEPNTWNIDPEKIEEKITKKTKAIIPVHLYGHPCNMDSILDIAKRYNLSVIEDASEAHGALYKGKKVGNLGDEGVFSFYGNKIITTGEGGMIVTNNEDWAKKAHFLRNQGMSKEKRYYHPEIGYNYRMTNLQAAIGVAQLEKIEEILVRKRKNALLYNSLLKGMEGITLPPEEGWAKNVYWMYCILIEDSFPMSRDELALKLREKEIDTRPFFIPMHQLPPYKERENYPIAEALSQRGINLPSSAALNEDQIEFICQTIKELL